MLTRSQKIQFTKLKKYGVTIEEILNPPKCKMCDNVVKWSSQNKKWGSYCSKKCMGDDVEFQQYRQLRVEQSMIKKYGVSNWRQSEQGRLFTSKNYNEMSTVKKQNIIEKRMRTCNENFGVPNAMMVDAIKVKQQLSNINTLKEKYNVTHNMHIDSVLNKSICNRKKTLIERYGVDCIFKDKKILKIANDKTKETLLKRYNVTSPSHIQGIVEKAMKNGVKAKKYSLPSGAVVYLRGYEPQFLDYIFENNILKETDIDYSPNRIPYNFASKLCYYHPDFFIKHYNLIVEIKSDYILKKQGKLKQKAKEAACKSLGYNYLLILNNNFTNIEERFK